MYVTPVQRTSSQLFVGRELDSQICVDAFVGRTNTFICDELHINGTAAAGFAEDLRRTIDNSMGRINYLK